MPENDAVRMVFGAPKVGVKAIPVLSSQEKF